MERTSKQRRAKMNNAVRWLVKSSNIGLRNALQQLLNKNEMIISWHIKHSDTDSITKYNKYYYLMQQIVEIWTCCVMECIGTVGNCTQNIIDGVLSFNLELLSLRLILVRNLFWTSDLYSFEPNFIAYLCTRKWKCPLHHCCRRSSS